MPARGAGHPNITPVMAPAQIANMHCVQYSIALSA